MAQGIHLERYLPRTFPCIWCSEETDSIERRFFSCPQLVPYCEKYKEKVNLKGQISKEMLQDDQWKSLNLYNKDLGPVTFFRQMTFCAFLWGLYKENTKLQVNGGEFRPDNLAEQAWLGAKQLCETALRLAKQSSSSKRLKLKIDQFEYLIKIRFQI